MRDTDLLEQYLQHGSESAFTDLVNRYVNLAYSVAQRQVRDPGLAEEVVQQTFCLLSQKARHLAQYNNLAGWIYRATYNLSLKALRNERIRREREHAMANLDQPTLGDTSNAPWESLVPLLDEALTQLPDNDRAVLVLRFTQHKPLREVGEAMGTSEAAAKMRLGRALDKLRHFFKGRGISCTSVSLIAAMAALSTTAAPAGLTASSVAAALAATSNGPLAAISLTTLLMHMAKLKTKLVLAGLGAAAVVLTGNYALNSYLWLIPRSGSHATSKTVGATNQTAQTGATEASGFSERWAAKLRDLGLSRAAAKLRSALDEPPRKGTRSYPSRAMEDAIAAFGPYHAEAFAILKAAIEDGNPEARQQAIAALGGIGRDVPEAKSLLWQLLKSGEDRACSLALMSLGNIGFLPEEISTLAGILPGQTDQQLIRYVPEAIARTIQRDPEGTKPYMASVEALLQHSDPAVRFGAACALAEHRGGQDKQILEGLASGLAVSEAYRIRREATGEAVRHLMAVETLQRVGPEAKSVLPELRTFAERTPDSLMRELALKAIGAIDVQAAQTEPEIQALIAKDERRNGLLERLQGAAYTPEDLAQGLKEPMTVSLAASKLAESGAAAKDSLPAMHEAMAGKDEATRDEILAAMKRIDPDYAVARVAREPVAYGAMAAQMELDRQIADGELNDAAAASLQKRVDSYRMGNTSWYTQRELAEFAQQIQKENPRLWDAFVAKATEVDTNFLQALEAKRR